ncbi:hypothetical protein KCU65_g414, partial [Aureobasidium melanogenum]
MKADILLKNCSSLFTLNGIPSGPISACAARLVEDTDGVTDPVTPRLDKNSKASEMRKIPSLSTLPSLSDNLLQAESFCIVCVPRFEETLQEFRNRAGAESVRKVATILLRLLLSGAGAKTDSALLDIAWDAANDLSGLYFGSLRSALLFLLDHLHSLLSFIKHTIESVIQETKITSTQLLAFRAKISDRENSLKATTINAWKFVTALSLGFSDLGWADSPRRAKYDLRTEMKVPSSAASRSSSPLTLRIAKPIWNKTLGPSRKKTSRTRKANIKGIELI